ncbi:MAG: class I SAM-dependent methyltransferase, partial [Candidatus Limnocylindria bacterium]
MRIECPGCHGERQSRALERYGEWRLYECLDCGLQHFWPAKNPGADYYEKSEMYAARDLMVVDWLAWYHRAGLERLPVRAGRLLDVGCGNGAFVAAAQRAGFEASGIDFSEKAIQAGRRRFGLERLYATSIEEFRAKERARPFDVVTAFEVLEHMDDVDRFLEEVLSLLAPGGYLVVSVPNRDRRPWLLNEGDLPPHHFTRWDRAALRHHMRRHGLETRSVIVCPTAITLKAFLHYRVRFGAVMRLLGRAQEAPAERREA